jgi:hypothetical protein
VECFQADCEIFSRYLQSGSLSRHYLRLPRFVLTSVEQ